MLSQIRQRLANFFGRSGGNSRPEYLTLLSGSGIEIGALHRPVHVPHLKVSYVDRMTRAELFEHYPELRKLQQPIVEADIIDCAETLATLADGSQNFVIANHVIEHMANPIKSLRTWARVLAPGGRLFLAVPDMRTTFDRERKKTTIAHLLEDFENPSRERDYEHFRDFALYVSCRFFKGRPESEAEQYAKELFDTDYSIHYHVWDYSSFKEFLEYLSGHFDDWPLRTVASMQTVKDEFIFVLERRA